MKTVPGGLVRLPAGGFRLIGNYRLDVRPVTNADYAAFIQATGAARPPWTGAMVAVLVVMTWAWRFVQERRRREQPTQRPEATARAGRAGPGRITSSRGS